MRRSASQKLFSVEELLATYFDGEENNEEKLEQLCWLVLKPEANLGVMALKSIQAILLSEDTQLKEAIRAKVEKMACALFPNIELDALYNDKPATRSLAWCVALKSSRTAHLDHQFYTQPNLLCYKIMMDF